jgi:transposase
MTKTQVEVITSVQRRRRWSRAEKERVVAAALEPGVLSRIFRTFDQAIAAPVSKIVRWYSGRMFM